jgi:hypothetical protein
LAGKIIADIIEAPAGRISLNVANVTVASINALGLFTSTGNLLITQANSIGTAAIEDGAVTNAKLTLAANASAIKTALNASGNPGIFAARAWVNFNGTGTVAIRASGNVSSITDLDTGNYRVNFATAMPDGNYAVAGSAGNDENDLRCLSVNNDIAPATTSVDIQVTSANQTNEDAPYVAVSIFR